MLYIPLKFLYFSQSSPLHNFLIKIFIYSFSSSQFRCPNRCRRGSPRQVARRQFRIGSGAATGFDQILRGWRSPSPEYSEKFAKFINFCTEKLKKFSFWGLKKLFLAQNSPSKTCFIQGL